MVAVRIPNDDMKARLIGRDGLTKRTFQEATGVILVIDDDPDQVFLKSPDNDKVQFARRVLECMIQDKRFKKEDILEYQKRMS